MNTNDIIQTTDNLVFNLDEVATYILTTGRDVSGAFDPSAVDGKGLVGFFLPSTTESENLLDQYRRGLLAVEPRRFSRLLGELHRRAGRIERAARCAGEVLQ
ncbi:MAG: hypothetical protein PHO83_14835 [Geobacteraceae bacterium]|nr:hypothetical protein [Geobacteraceae bacterium]